MSFRNAKFWLLIVNDATDFCWSYFLKAKSELGVTVIHLIEELYDLEGICVQKIHCDNAGENKKLQQLMQE